MLPFAESDGEALFQGRLYFPKSRKSSRNVKILSFAFMLPFAKFEGEAYFQGRLYIPKSRKSSRNIKIMPMLQFNENSLIYRTCYLVKEKLEFGMSATFSQI